MKKFISFLMFAAAFCACSEIENEGGLSDPTKTPARPIELTRAEYRACDQVKNFSYDFIRQANTAAKGKNYFVSPLSAEMALAMLCNGTAGETEQEIRKVLGFEDFTLDDLVLGHDFAVDDCFHMNHTPYYFPYQIKYSILKHFIR